MAVLRWTFKDGSGTSSPVPRNPREMTSLFPEKALTVKSTTAMGYGTILIEGERQPTQWTFTGDIVDADHYEQLRRWTYDVAGRVVITDHFGRTILCYLQKLDAVPQRKANLYWRHTYTITALVFSVGAPTVGDEAP